TSAFRSSSAPIVTWLQSTKHSVHSPSTSDYCFALLVRWLRFFLLLASRVRPSTPPLSHRVLRHFFEAHSFGLGTDGIHTCPQTSHTATFCIRQPMVAIIHNARGAENT